jgi:alginate O-acetyltransferase complex protein AlgI
MLHRRHTGVGRGISKWRSNAKFGREWELRDASIANHLQQSQPRRRMLFNSFVFWAFFLLVWLIYIRLPLKPQNWLLLFASYIFYGAWDWRFLSLIWFSTIVDFLVGRTLGHEESQSRRKLLLAVSVVTNLGLLGFFKYFNFFAAEFANFVSVFGLTAHEPTLRIILPVGISFYTFQTLSYTIDIYRRQLLPASSLLNFSLYVAFFPQLVAGPIERSKHLLPQIQSIRRVGHDDLRSGIYDIVYGLFLKVVVADNMAPLANAVFAGGYSGGDTLIGVYAFALQIYGDFAGYSFIARGVARLLGIDLMLNFQRPYFAMDPSDFWRRWHISLSSWLRDYLYIPLGGSRGGKVFTYRNLMITMLLGGLWHGAAWTFVIWGGIHGILLIGYRIMGIGTGERALAAVADGAGHRKRPVWAAPREKSRNALQAILLFQMVCVSWIFFRADSLSQAFAVLRAIVTNFTFSPFALGAASTILFFAGPLILYEMWLEAAGDHARLLREQWWTRAVGYAYCALMLIFFPTVGGQQFIYFQF